MRLLVPLLCDLTQLIQTNSAAKAASSSSFTSIATSRRSLPNIMRAHKRQDAAFSSHVLRLDNDLRVHTNFVFFFFQKKKKRHQMAACPHNTYSLSWVSSEESSTCGVVLHHGTSLFTPNITNFKYSVHMELQGVDSEIAATLRRSVIHMHQRVSSRDSLAWRTKTHRWMSASGARYTRQDQDFSHTTPNRCDRHTNNECCSEKTGTWRLWRAIVVSVH